MLRRGRDRAQVAGVVLAAGRGERRALELRPQVAWRQPDVPRVRGDAVGRAGERREPQRVQRGAGGEVHVDVLPGREAPRHRRKRAQRAHPLLAAPLAAPRNVARAAHRMARDQPCEIAQRAPIAVGRRQPARWLIVPALERLDAHVVAARAQRQQLVDDERLGQHREAIQERDDAQRRHRRNLTGACGSVVAMGVAAGVAPAIESRAPGAQRDAVRVDQAGEQRLARVESVRALAALGVVVGHVWGAHHAFGAGARDSLLARTIFGGGYGVYVFFALSGYLLYRPLAAATFGGGKVDLRRYAINRVLRILPLYYVVVVVLLVVQEGGGTPGQWLRFLTLTENLFRSTALTVDAPIWSLIVELQFYALLPFVAIGLAWVARGSRRNAAVLVLAFGARAVACCAGSCSITATPPTRASSTRCSRQRSSSSRACCSALAHDVRLPRALRSADLWLLASIPVWLWIFDDYTRTPMGGGRVLPRRRAPSRCRSTPGPLTRALDWRPLALLGVASYSLYLWHLPIVEALTPHALGAVRCRSRSPSRLRAIGSSRRRSCGCAGAGAVPRRARRTRRSCGPVENRCACSRQRPAWQDRRAVRSRRAAPRPARRARRP